MGVKAEVVGSAPIKHYGPVMGGEILVGRCMLHDRKFCGQRPDPTPATLDSAEKGGYPSL